LQKEYPKISPRDHEKEYEYNRYRKYQNNKHRTMKNYCKMHGAEVSFTPIHRKKTRYCLRIFQMTRIASSETLTGMPNKIKRSVHVAHTI
jgi:hypothetical protein